MSGTREEMVHIYERVVTTFVFGVDAADELIWTNVFHHDGSITREKQTCYSALDNLVNVNYGCCPKREIVGELPLTAALRAGLDNKNKFVEFL